MRKRISILLLLLPAVILSSCSFHKGAKEKPAIGLSYSYSGITVSDVKLYDSYRDNPLIGKKIPYGNTLYVAVEGISKLTVENGRVYPGCEVTVTDLNGNIALQGKDLYPAEGYTVEESATLYLEITMAAPVVAGETYKTTARIYDKKNPEKGVDITIESEVAEPALQNE